jgi:Na+/H+ antiporter NhaD/arsenite permease-like protein
LIPSLFACLIPALIIARKFKGQPFIAPASAAPLENDLRDGLRMLIAAVSILLLIPFFKTLTGLPPFMGMLLGLGIMWIVTTIIHKKKEDHIAEQFSVSTALQKIDSPSILFFLGILLSVAALESAGILHIMSNGLVSTLKNDYLIGSSLGMLSAFVDNVPLVAATQGMFDLNTFPKDDSFWQFLALSTGTGGSAIIIGSAAGVAIMGLEKIPFGWYLRRVTFIAILGFVVGIGTFLLQRYLLHL